MWTSFKDFIEFVTVLLLFYVLVFWPQGTWDLSSTTRDSICTPCIGRWSFNHWTTREVSSYFHLTMDSYWVHQLDDLEFSSERSSWWTATAHDHLVHGQVLYLYHAQLLKDLIFQRYVNFSLQIITSSTILSAYVVIFPLRLPWTSHCRFTLYLSVPQMPPTPYGLPNCLTQPTGLLASETQLGESCSWPKGSCAYSPERCLLGEPDFSRTQKILPETLLLYLQYGI